MNFSIYILFSKNLNKYYIGYTSLSVEERSNYHISKHKGFTSKSKDWNIVYTFKLDSKIEALRLEKKIKKRGAKRFIEDVANF